MKKKIIKMTIPEVSVRSTQAQQLAMNTNFGTRTFSDKRFRKPKHKLREREMW